MTRLRELHQARENLPLRGNFGSNVSLDRFFERNLHGLNSNEQSCSKYLKSAIKM